MPSTALFITSVSLVAISGLFYLATAVKSTGCEKESNITKNRKICVINDWQLSLRD